MDSLQATEILDLLQEERNNMVSFLEELTLAESPSSVPSSQEEVMKILIHSLRALGFHTKKYAGKNTGGYLYSRPLLRNRGEPLQLLVGHCDTVWPIKTLEKMPFVADSETIKGPGVYDMKGGLTQIIFALKALYFLKYNPPVRPVVLINSDEEIGSRESTPVIRRLSKIVDRAFVLEPSLGVSGKLKTERKGVGRFTVRVRGQSAHAGLDPGKGANAIVELSFIIQELFKMNDPEKQVSVNVGMVEGGLRPNVVAPESTAVIDVRVPNQAEADRITRMIHALQPTNQDVSLEIEGSIGRAPLEFTPRNEHLFDEAKTAAGLLGIKLDRGMAGGASDGNTTSLYTATLDGLGAIGDGAHAPHEFLYVDKMIERTALLALLIMMEPMN